MPFVLFAVELDSKLHDTAIEIHDETIDRDLRNFVARETENRGGGSV
jgi:hypothetical protein